MQFEESTDLIDTSFITEIVVVVVVVVVQRERERVVKLFGAPSYKIGNL